MPELPTGTVTFLFTDIQGSTALWEQHRDTMRAALVRHDALVEQVVAEHAGHIVRPRGEGDSRFAVFARATDAVAAAAALQQALSAEPWPTTTPLRVRMALHTGEADLREGDYYGSAVNRCARLRAVAHGGQTLVSLTTEQLVRGQLASEVSLRDLGAHRLRDLHHPEHVFELVTDGVPADFPPLQTLDARPNNLPLQPTSFIGREQEIAAARQRLRDPQVRLLTMTGPGGTGKTRLALQVAAELLDHFADGIWLVELAPMHDPALVSSAIAAALGVKESAAQPVAENLKLYLRDKHLLLVLDNFEQVQAAAPGAAELLAAASGLKLLVTSREALHLRAEQEYPVSPLPLPDLTRPPTLEQLSQYAAVALFIQRAQAVRPDFTVTNANAPAVAEICVRLDGLPLAIELAAARVKMLPPEALLQRLGKRLKLLTGGARDLPARQQTLRSAIDWSYNLLDPAEQTLFRRLGVFVGGCTLAAVEAVCGADGDLAVDAMEGVASLIDKSLVRQEEVGAEPRFTMLETIREYALEQVAASEVEMLRRWHARHYLMWAEAAMLKGLHVETDNIRAALQWTLNQGEEELGWLPKGAFWFWLLPSPQSTMDLVIPALRKRLTTLPLALRGYALIILGRHSWLRGDYEQALTLLEQSVAQCRVVGDLAASAEALHYLADVRRDQGAYAEADKLYMQSLASYQELEDKRGSAWVFHSSAELALLQADSGRSLALDQASLALFRELGDSVGIDLSLLNQGFALHQAGDSQAAARLFRERLALAQPQETSETVVLSLVGLAEVAATMHRPGWDQGAARAAHILGTVEMLLKSSGISLPGAHRRAYEQSIAAAHARLDEASFAAAWAEGQAMTVEQAITYALEEMPDA